MESIIHVVFAFITIVLYLHNIYIKLQWNPVHNNYVVSVAVKYLFFIYEQLISEFGHVA